MINFFTEFTFKTVLIYQNTIRHLIQTKALLLNFCPAPRIFTFARHCCKMLRPAHSWYKYLDADTRCLLRLGGPIGLCPRWHRIMQPNQLVGFPNLLLVGFPNLLLVGFPNLLWVGFPNLLFVGQPDHRSQDHLGWLSEHLILSSWLEICKLSVLPRGAMCQSASRLHHTLCCTEAQTWTNFSANLLNTKYKQTQCQIQLQ